MLNDIISSLKAKNPTLHPVYRLAVQNIDAQYGFINQPDLMGRHSTFQIINI